jgi:23S rRNA (cytidine1920-2'-O)/16S rRNA (cytidine1409-2'-O)-methyltransferase
LRVRLDQLLVTRGLASSRQRARALILAGDVSVAGVSGAKAGTLVDPDANVTVRIPDHPWVGRGGVKLAHAFEAFGIDPAGWVALDIGASTGGFTDVLVQRGARLVVALDVGRNQLDWKLRNDPRVRVLERINARYLRAADLPEDARAFDLVTIDVAFISLRQILPVVPPLLRPGALVIALVKPQFEAGRQDVRKGIVTDPAIHERVIEEVTSAAQALGLERAGLERSPIEGAEGNKEFFICLKRVNSEFPVLHS